MRENIKIKDKGIIECYMILSECLRFDNIENRRFIKQQLEIFQGYKKIIPLEEYEKLRNFTEDVIMPIMKCDYFDFLKRSAYGSDTESSFIINSETSLEKMIFELYDHTIMLQKELLELMISLVTCM